MSALSGTVAAIRNALIALSNKKEKERRTSKTCSSTIGRSNGGFILKRKER